MIDYVCDFGDSWEHRLIVTWLRPDKPSVSYPHYVGGEWDCLLADCGDIPGYYNMLDAFADPNRATAGQGVIRLTAVVRLEVSRDGCIGGADTPSDATGR